MSWFSAFPSPAYEKEQGNAQDHHDCPEANATTNTLNVSQSSSDPTVAMAALFINSSTVHLGSWVVVGFEAFNLVKRPPSFIV